ncbi:ATP-binding protein [Halobacterium zhouii]|uniref:ATP-binding protein n=1 Tax=Halobacterium zhouii TaxID=2902624 RepID=UPI001E30EEBE|nr:DUF87 domain-containing protein [Halobacterium zhouii]
MVQSGDELEVTEDGVSLPAAEVLTGRGFVTGKSGSGKSNTVSVFAEELLSLDARLLVIDTDGEYYGLKEGYEVLHLGAGDQCDVEVKPENAKIVSELVLADGVPVVLDVSGFLEVEEANELVYEVAKHVFATAGSIRQPCLMLVEECHEYIPEQGGLGDVGEMLVRIAKRGRKRGLGLCGLSQRPAAVDKDFITQCDWLAWHRLTWANDTKVVKRVLGPEYAEEIESLDTGESFLVTDWDESIRRVKFRKKNTFDAGATPGFGETRDPDLKPVPQSWLDAFAATKFKKDPEGVEDGVDAAPDRGGDDEEPEESAGVLDDVEESASGQAADASSSGDTSSADASETSSDDAADSSDAGGTTSTASSASSSGRNDDAVSNGAAGRGATDAGRGIIQEHDGPGVHRGRATSGGRVVNSRDSRRSFSPAFPADLAERLDAMDDWVDSRSPRVTRTRAPPRDAQSVALELGEMVTFVGKAIVWGVFAALYYVVRHVVGALLVAVAYVAGGVRYLGYRAVAAVRSDGRRATAATREGAQRSGSVLRRAARRGANGLRAVGRRTRRAAGTARDAVFGPRDDRSRVIVGGRDESDEPRSDGGEERERPTADLLVGGAVLAVAVAAVAVVAVAATVGPASLLP